MIKDKKYLFYSLILTFSLYYCISILRAFSLVVFPTDDNEDNPNYFKGAMMYFILGSIAQIANIVLILLASKSKYYVFYTETAKNEAERNNSDESGLLNGGTPKSNNSYLSNQTNDQNDNANKETGLNHIMRVHNNMAVLGWGLAIIYLQTFLVFPAVLLVGGIDFISNNSWQVWFIITLFNVQSATSYILIDLIN